MSGNVLARYGDPESLAAEAAPALRERQPGAASGTSTGDSTSVDPRVSVPLTSLGRHATGTVAGVRIASSGANAETDPALERMALRLIEIGFVQGAQLRVIAFGQPGNDPIGVRVGGRGGISTFALRRQEASCVWVWPDQ